MLAVPDRLEVLDPDRLANRGEPRRRTNPRRVALGQIGDLLPPQPRVPIMTFVVRSTPAAEIMPA